MNAELVIKIFEDLSLTYFNTQHKFFTETLIIDKVLI